MSTIDVLGYAGAIFVIATYSMKTMIPLRAAGIAANCIFIVYGYLSAAYPTLLLHAILLPLNATRLYQMLKLVKRVSAAVRGDLSMNWLKPYMTSRSYVAGEVIFRAGEVADSMFYTVSGRYRLREIGVSVGPGEIIGELGIVAPENARTQTFECVEAGEALTISYGDVRQLYFQNPKFGFYFLQLISERLFRDIDRLQSQSRPAGDVAEPNAPPGTAAAG